MSHDFLKSSLSITFNDLDLLGCIQTAHLILIWTFWDCWRLNTFHWPFQWNSFRPYFVSHYWKCHLYSFACWLSHLYNKTTKQKCSQKRCFKVFFPGKNESSSSQFRHDHYISVCKIKCTARTSTSWCWRAINILKSATDKAKWTCDWNYFL